MKLECINGCKDTWFGYMAKADIEIEVTTEGEELESTINNYNQSGSAICRKCGKEATQVFEKCSNCKSYQEDLQNKLCRACRLIEAKTQSFERITAKYSFKK